MSKVFLHAAIAAALSMCITAPGVAQTLDTSAIEAACAPVGASEADCLAAIEAYIASIAGLPAAEADIALGAIAATLAASSLVAGTGSPVIAGALSAIALAVTDPAQANQIAELSTTVETGTDLPVAAVGEPVPASPS